MAHLVGGIGVSHSPMLNAEAEDWSRFVERDRVRSHLDKAGRPVTYDALIERAGPAMAACARPDDFARRHAAAMAHLARVKTALRAARLDTLVVIGDDQKEMFDDGNMPAILIYRGKTIRNVPLRADAAGMDWAKRLSARYYEPSVARDYPVAADLAHHLIEELVGREFDAACADSIAPGKGEGHAFGFVHNRLLDGVELPVVPVLLNTYYPPNQPNPGRCYRLGQAIAAAIASWPGAARVGVLASGGLSHFTVDEDLDGDVIRALRDKDGAALRALPPHKLNSGSSEIRNWICAAGALEARPLDWIEYVPGYRTPAGTGTGLCFAVWS